jgi:hemin uptake protein HemP
MQPGSRQKSASNQNHEPAMRFQGGRVLSNELLGERGELTIEHEGREYRLRRTQTGKLILTA